MKVSRVKQELLKVLQSRKLAERWIKLGIKSIKPEDFVSAMKGGFSPARLIFNHFHSYVQNPVLRPLIQTIFKAYWDVAEYYLTDVKKVYDLLWENPKLRNILQTPEAKRYLNYAVAASYVALYEFVWLDRDPFVVKN